MARADYITAREFDKLYDRLESIEKKAEELSTNVANINGRMTMTTTAISIGMGLFSFFINYFVRGKA